MVHLMLTTFLHTSSKCLRVFNLRPMQSDKLFNGMLNVVPPLPATVVSATLIPRLGHTIVMFSCGWDRARVKQYILLKGDARRGQQGKRVRIENTWAQFPHIAEPP